MLIATIFYNLPFQVRVVSGMSYILNENEDLWSKELPSTVDDLLGIEADPLAERGLRGKLQEGSKKKRKKTDAVTYRVPHNAAVQIYDYKEKKARFVGEHHEILISLSLLSPPPSGN